MMKVFLLLSLQQVVQAGFENYTIKMIGITEEKQEKLRQSSKDRGAIEDGIGAILEAIAAVISAPAYVITEATDLAVFCVEMCIGFTYEVANGVAGPVLEVWSDLGELVGFVIKLPISVVQIGLDCFSWTSNEAGNTVWEVVDDAGVTVEIEVAVGSYELFHTWDENGIAVDYNLSANGSINWLPPPTDHTMHCKASRPCPEGFSCAIKYGKAVGYCEKNPETTTTTKPETTKPETTADDTPTSSAMPEQAAADGDYGNAVSTGISTKYAILIGLLAFLSLCCTAFAMTKCMSRQDQTENITRKSSGRPTISARAATPKRDARVTREKLPRRKIGMANDATEFQRPVIPATTTQSTETANTHWKAVRTARLQRRLANIEIPKI